MFDLGIQELVVIFVVALLVFGPKRLPELARNLGKGMGQLKKALVEMKTEVDREVEDVSGNVPKGLDAWQKENPYKFPPGMSEESDEAMKHTSVNPPDQEETKEEGATEAEGPVAEATAPEPSVEDKDSKPQEGQAK